MNPKAMGGAAAAALVGAAVWALVMKWTGYQVGWVAWGVGGLIGGTAVFLGARAMPEAAVCAALALVAIVLGKHLGIGAIMASHLKKNPGTRAVFEELREDARLYARVRGDEATHAFMSERKYSSMQDPTQIPAAEVAAFRRDWAPKLVRMEQEGWTLDDFIEDTLKDADRLALLKDSFQPLDIIFLLLGLVTAFQLVVQAGTRERAARRASARRRAGEDPEDPGAHRPPPPPGRPASPRAPVRRRRPR